MNAARMMAAFLLVAALTGCAASSGNSSKPVAGPTRLATPELDSQKLAASTRFDSGLLCDGWSSCDEQRAALAAGTRFLQALVAGRADEASGLLSSFLLSTQTPASVSASIGGGIALLQGCGDGLAVFSGWSRKSDGSGRSYFTYPYSYLVNVKFFPPCRGAPVNGSPPGHGVASCLVGVSEDVNRFLVIEVGKRWAVGFPACASA